MVNSRKELEIILSQLKGYINPKEKLEQWQTPSNIASTMLFEAYIRGDIANRKVLDLGAGTGILTIGAALLGAREVIGVEIDPDALEVAKNNLKRMERLFGHLSIRFVCDDITNFNEHGDTVVMNPPFGLEVNTRHADILFLSKAFSLAKSIYSLHHSSDKGRKFLIHYAQKHNFEVDLIGTFMFPLRAWHIKHKKPVKFISVDFFLFKKINNSF